MVWDREHITAESHLTMSSDILMKFGSEIIKCGMEKENVSGNGSNI